MKTETTIYSQTNKFNLGYWDKGEDELVEINDDNRKEAGEQLGCSKEFLEFLESNLRGLAEIVHEDLVQIWNRFDKLEK